MLLCDAPAPEWLYTRRRGGKKEKARISQSLGKDELMQAVVGATR